jgi:hypothetical protein
MELERQTAGINPSDAADSAIEYLTPKGERRTLAYADLVDTVYRAPMRPREGAAREASDRKGRAHYLRRRVQTLPAFIRKRFSLRLESLERHDPKRPCAGCSARLNACVTPRRCGKRPIPTASNLPAILLPLRDDFHLLPWADKNA